MTKSRLGSLSNPIKLVNESIVRDLLVKHARHTSRGIFDFNSLPDQDYDSFIMNVLTNPHLTFQEAKLAIYFHQYLPNEGTVYTTSFSNSFMPAYTYGGLFKDKKELRDGILIGTEDSIRGYVEYCDDDGEYVRLPDISEMLCMKLTSQKLLGLLKRLHDFGYITITDINEKNTYFKSKKNTEKKDKRTRARLRHIRLCRGMCNKDLSGRWLPKKEKIKDKKINNSILEK